MANFKAIITPICFLVISSPLFYVLINRIKGVFFIFMVLGVFGISLFISGLLFELKYNLAFTILSIISLIISYLISLFIGIWTLKYLLAIVTGNILMSFFMFYLDHWLYGAKANSAVIYAIASFLSIIAIYAISVYTDKEGVDVAYSFVYSIGIYIYLQASIISHYLAA